MAPNWLLWAAEIIHSDLTVLESPPLANKVSSQLLGPPDFQDNEELRLQTHLTWGLSAGAAWCQGMEVTWLLELTDGNESSFPSCLELFSEIKQWQQMLSKCLTEQWLRILGQMQRAVLRGKGQPTSTWQVSEAHRSWYFWEADALSIPLWLLDFRPEYVFWASSHQRKDYT